MEIFFLHAKHSVFFPKDLQVLHSEFKPVLGILESVCTICHSLDNRVCLFGSLVHRLIHGQKLSKPIWIQNAAFLYSISFNNGCSVMVYLRSVLLKLPLKNNWIFSRISTHGLHCYLCNDIRFVLGFAAAFPSDKNNLRSFPKCTRSINICFSRS